MIQNLILKRLQLGAKFIMFDQKYILDTCVCIEIMRGKLPNAFAQISLNGFDSYVISSIVAAELWTGVYKSKQTHKNAALLISFLKPFTIMPFNATCAKEYGQLRAYLEKEGIKIGNNDTLIAAQALSYDVGVITNNLKEFARVPNLDVQTWNKE